MNIDILASDNYFQINKKLAFVFGIAEAVYLTELFNICKKAFNKKTFNPDTGEFKLDRKYIQKQTTIKPSQQSVYDQKFQECGILEVNAENIDVIKMDTAKVVSIITCEDIKALTEMVPASKQLTEAKKESKRNGIIQMLKNTFTEQDPDVKQALENWVEVVYDKGICKKVQVLNFESQLNSYTQDKEAKLDLLNICINQGYKLLDWAIQIYERKQSAVRTTKQKQSQGLDTNNTF